jgi:DNA-binding CsgD family transcriptional regulator
MADAFERILLALYGRLTEDDWATEVLREVTRATRSRSAALVAVDLVQKRDALPAFVGAEASSALAYEREFGAHNPWRPPHGVLSQTAGELRVSDDVLPLSDLKRTLFWSDFLRPMGVAHGVGLIGFNSRARVASMTLLRDERRGSYRGAELVLLKRLSPHWVQACVVRERLGLLVDKERAMADVIDALATAVLLLDREGHVVHTNPAAEDILRRGEWLLLHHGRPTASHGIGTELLTRAIDGALAGPLLVVSPSVVPLENAEGKTVAHAAAHALGGGRYASIASVALFVQPAGFEGGERMARRALRDAYGLTEREAELVCLLDGTHELREVAELMGITLGGARTRLKTVCAKMGVRGQTELSRTLASLRVALGQRGKTS